MKKTIIFCLLLISISARAQNNFLYITWDISKPLTNTSWLGSTTTKGGKAGYRGFVNDRISIGGDFNWTTYDEYSPTETFQFENGAITTDYFKYIYQYGFTASGQYYFPIGDHEHFFPYAGLGLGANYMRYTMYYNIYTEEDNGWGFLARPEAGVLVRFGARRSLGLMAAVHYDYTTNKSELFDYDGFSAFGFQIGAIFMNRR
ncbi:MAG TPA: outer membrane beta-barrel protein [Ohtaekwangia sp.]